MTTEPSPVDRVEEALEKRRDRAVDDALTQLRYAKSRVAELEDNLKKAVAGEPYRRPMFGKVDPVLENDTVRLAYELVEVAAEAREVIKFYAEEVQS